MIAFAPPPPVAHVTPSAKAEAIRPTRAVAYRAAKIVVGDLATSFDSTFVLSPCTKVAGQKTRLCFARVIGPGAMHLRVRVTAVDGGDNYEVSLRRVGAE